MKQELVGLFTMAAMIEARDPFTVGHAWRVSRYCRLIAENSVQSEALIAQVSIAGFLHDLGKIGISDAVLTRPEHLIESEYEIVKEHSAVGARLLAGHPVESLVADVIRHHHEHFDGTGYPDGLAGQNIPLAARIVGVCDAFDAMTSTRPWRKAMPLDKVLGIIEAGYGTQFDQDFAERLVRLARGGDLSHILGHSDLGVPIQNCPNCGPCVTVFRTHRAGDKVYCRMCANEFEVQYPNGGTLRTVPTGGKGRPSVAVAEPDAELISRLILDALGHLPH
ncbi:MAG: phosphohydrolase [Proteobacteria bacterium]|nr:phosphohydrolase [Pseudomonadota bacterium]